MDNKYIEAGKRAEFKDTMENIRERRKARGENPHTGAKKEKVAKKMLPKENVQDAVSYKKSRTHRLLKEQEKRITAKYN